MLPVNADGGQLASITANGSPVVYTTEIIKGIEYAFFPAIDGGYVATYDAENARLSSEIMKESNAVSLQVYPNPSLGESLQVEAQGLESYEEVKITIYNSMGGVVATYPATADQGGNIVKELHFPHKLHSGIYTVMLQSNAHSMSHKIVISQ
jgi:hypothetical protein